MYEEWVRVALVGFIILSPIQPHPGGERAKKQKIPKIASTMVLNASRQSLMGDRHT